MANPANRTAASPAVVCAAGALSLAVAMGIGRFAFTPMLPLMIGEGRLDVAAGGWLAAANYAGYLAGALTASRIPWSAARLGVVALLLTAALTAAMA
ncbi:MAG: YbfB/YjiJ family MFS transporter, partial [Ramlibacter sp.]